MVYRVGARERLKPAIRMMRPDLACSRAHGLREMSDARFVSEGFPIARPTVPDLRRIKPRAARPGARGSITSQTLDRGRTGASRVGFFGMPLNLDQMPALPVPYRGGHRSLPREE